MKRSIRARLVVRSLEGRLIGGRALSVRIFPVETRNLAERLQLAIEQTSPQVIIGTGLAAGRTALALERVALNVLDFKVPDNAGVMRRNDVIVPGGPDARLSQLPFDEILRVWTEHGVPGYISNSAGTYICNQFLYEALTAAERISPAMVAGFVHLPYLPAQAAALGAEKTPSMAFELMKRGIESLIETVVPWVEQRMPDREPANTTTMGSQLWIPRGVKEIER